MALLRFSAWKHRQKLAVVDEKEEISYENLYREAQRLANILQSDYQLKPKQKVAFLCRSHASLIRAVFSASRLGASIYLLNPEISAQQFTALSARHKFDFLFYDTEISSLIDDSVWRNKSLASYHPTLSSVETLPKRKADFFNKLKPAFSGEIIVLTGGTTGEPKIAKRKPSIFNFLNPFFELLTKLNLDDYQSVYIATPAYHGFGIAAIFISLVLGEKIFLLSRFDAETACSLIKNNKIQVVTVVPLMLQRMMRYDTRALSSLKCVISGGAALSSALVEETLEKIGDKLFNLYGTSEAGFSVLATPEDLRSAPDTIGRKIKGVKLSLLDEDNNPVAAGKIGRICIKSKWSVKSNEIWVETGDLGCQDTYGRLFLRGRCDEMIVSGGENVYPIELENVLLNHPDIEQAAVIGIPDDEFGERLKAFIVFKSEKRRSEAEILSWLENKIARFQMPKAIKFVEKLPTTSIGKINKKDLT